MGSKLVAAIVLVIVVLVAPPVLADAGPDRPRAMVTGLAPDREVDPGLTRVLDDVFLARVRSLGVFEVISSDEIAALLDLEAQRQLMGCEDEGCIADIGGALGASYAITGSVSRLGDGLSLSLRLFDVDASRVLRHLREPLSTDEARASREIDVAADRLLHLPLTDPLPPPPAPPPPFYRRPWVWGPAAGAAVVGATLGAVVLMRPGPNLGTVILDG